MIISKSILGYTEWKIKHDSVEERGEDLRSGNKRINIVLGEGPLRKRRLGSLK